MAFGGNIFNTTGVSPSADLCTVTFKAAFPGPGNAWYTKQFYVYQGATIDLPLLNYIFSSEFPTLVYTGVLVNPSPQIHVNCFFIGWISESDVPSTYHGIQSYFRRGVLSNFIYTSSYPSSKRAQTHASADPSDLSSNVPSDPATVYSPGKTITVNSDLTFCAYWGLLSGYDILMHTDTIKTDSGGVTNTSCGLADMNSSYDQGSNSWVYYVDYFGNTQSVGPMGTDRLWPTTYRTTSQIIVDKYTAQSGRSTQVAVELTAGNAGNSPEWTVQYNQSGGSRWDRIHIQSINYSPDMVYGTYIFTVPVGPDEVTTPDTDSTLTIRNVFRLISIIYVAPYTSTRDSSVTFTLLNGQDRGTANIPGVWTGQGDYTYSSMKGTTILLPNGEIRDGTRTIEPPSGMKLGCWTAPYAGGLDKPLGTFVIIGDGISNTWTAKYSSSPCVIAFDYNAADVNRDSNNHIAFLTSSGSIVSLNGTATIVKYGNEYQLLGWTWSNAPTASTESNTEYDRSVFFGAGFKITPLSDYMEMKAVWIRTTGQSPPQPSTVRFTFSVPEGVALPSPDAANDYTIQIDANQSDVKVALPIYNCIIPGYHTKAWDGNINYAGYKWLSMNGGVHTQTFERDTYTIQIVYMTNRTPTDSEQHHVVTYDHVDLDTDTITIGSSTGYTDPSRFEYDFLGWNPNRSDASAGSANRDFNPGSSISANTAAQAAQSLVGHTYTLNLYAAWAPKISGFNLIYNSNCSDGTSSVGNDFQEQSTGGHHSYTLSTAIPERRDSTWQFLGWAEGTTIFSNTVVTFVEQSTPDIPGYPYRAEYSNQTITANMTGTVEFNAVQTATGYYSDTCTVATGVLYLYASEDVGEQAIPTITLNVPGSALSTTPTYLPTSFATITLHKSVGQTVTRIIYGCWSRWERRLAFTSVAGTTGIPGEQVSYSHLQSNATYIISKTVPQLAGRVFDKWLGPNSTVFLPGSTISVPPVRSMLAPPNQKWFDGTSWISTPIPTTLTAQWVGRYAQLIYDANGGEGAPASQYTESTSASSETYTISSTIPTRRSYRFLGWDRDRKDAIDFVYSDGSFSPSTITVDYGSVVTIYAMWAHIIDQTGGSAVYDEYGKLTSFAPDGLPELTIDSGTAYINDDMLLLASFPLDGAPSFDSAIIYDYSSSTLEQIVPDWIMIGGQVMMTIDDSAYMRSYAAITEFSVPGIYLIRLIGSTADGEDADYFIKLIVNQGDAGDRSEPQCYLEKTVMTATGLSTTRLDLRHVSNISKTYKVSLNDTYIMTKPVRTRYVMDLGNVESYEVTVTRTNLGKTPDAADPKDLTNPEWIRYFQSFTDVWQNSTYNRDYSTERKTGGFRFVYIPPDRSRFPMIDKNVYINGTISAQYLPDKLSIKIPLIVSSMIAKDGEEGNSTGCFLRLYTLRYTQAGQQPERELWHSSSIYIGMPTIIPGMPVIYDTNGVKVDCAMWRAVNANGDTATFTPFQSVTWEEISRFAVSNDEDTGGYLYPLRFITTSYLVLRPDSSQNKSYGNEITVQNGTIRIDHNGYVSVTVVGGGGGGGRAEGITGLYVDSYGQLRGTAVLGGGGGSGDVLTKNLVASSVITISDYSIGEGGEEGDDGEETYIVADTPAIGRMEVQGGDRGGDAYIKRLSPITFNLIDAIIQMAKYISDQRGGTGGEKVIPGGSAPVSNFHHTAWHWNWCEPGKAKIGRYGKIGIAGAGTPQGAGGGAAPLEITINLSDGTQKVLTSCGGDGLNRELTNTGTHEVDFDTGVEQSGKHGSLGGGGASAAWASSGKWSGKGGDGAIIIKCMGIEGA